MDNHAAICANRLLDNPLDAPVLELLLQGAVLRALSPVWIAVTGADASSNLPLWRAVRMEAGELIEFPHNRSGVWTYVAVESGFSADPWLGSVSGLPRAGLGQVLGPGASITCAHRGRFVLPPGVAGRFVDERERRDYSSPPVLRVWPGPQWSAFSASAREAFFESDWTVTARSDRVGYRLEGSSLFGERTEILSEPMRVGTIQIPGNGQPIVSMRDGPTVGGYAKFGMVDPEDLSWLAQCRPGQEIRFVPIDAAGS
jgi:biotin-dependent carboxylase-like uncharacterized protein